MIIEFMQLLTIVFCLSKLSVSISEKLPKIKILNMIRPIIGCRSCASFYLALIFSHSIFIASLVWLLMYFYVLKLESEVEKINL